MIKKFLLFFALFIVAFVFLASAYLKLYPIEPFEFSFVDEGVSSWKLAPFFARTLIGIEFLIGGLLLFNLYLKKFTYKATIVLLVFFTLYLIFQIIFYGNKGNCGCFGTAIEFTPLQAIIKNLTLLILIFILFRHHKGIDYGKHSRDVFIAITTTALILPYVINPINFEYAESYLNKPKEGYKLKLETLYKNAYLNEPPKSLSKGKHVIAFLSLTCPHCRIAAKKMRIIHDRNPEISFYFVLNGKNEALEEFFNDTRSEEIPFCLLKGKFFVELAGLELPVIYLVNNSMVEYNLDYNSVDEEGIQDWIKE